MEITKIINEVADYIYENPIKTQPEVRTYFNNKYGKQIKGVFASILSEAKKYNNEKSELHRKTQLDKIIKNAIKSEDRRELLLRAYTDIILDYVNFRNDKNYVPKEVQGQILIPTVQDVVAAGREICKIDGYYNDVTNINIQQNFVTEKSIFE